MPFDPQTDFTPTQLRGQAAMRKEQQLSDSRRPEYPIVTQSEAAPEVALVWLDEYTESATPINIDQARDLVHRLYMVHGVTILPRGMG